MMLNEMERSLHDALCVEQRVMESKSLVVGGGAVESALYMHLQEFALTLDTNEQLAVQAFGKALLVIPKTLAVNAAKDATDLVARLCSHHADKNDLESKFCGLDLNEGVVANNLKRGVLEPTMNKVKCLKFATEAAITILRIDDMIKINPAVRDE
jgi:T-complex protein 1 subunit alpha